MSDTHAARPTDLVALVTFDGDDVRENQAVTRERLGRAPEAPRPLNAALEHWLGLGTHTWITVRGRQVHGIATARELSAKSAWQIDTLIDADSADADADSGEAAANVLGDLLRQACLAAEQAHVTHILLRTPADSPAVEQALRAGFAQVLHERLWSGTLGAAVQARDEADGAGEVRPATDAHTFALFQLYSRALPIEARQALAMTLEEWQALRERRWCSHGESLIAATEDRVAGSLRLASDDGLAQLELVLEPTPAGALAGAALLRAARAYIDAGEPVLALVPTTAAAEESFLREQGLAPSTEFILLSRRIARPMREAAHARAGIAVPTGG